MTVKPVFLFAFDNDKYAYLENLKEEERLIRGIFSHLHDKGIIEFISLGSTTKEDIFSTVERFLDRLALFHYGGHAGGTQLFLEDGIASSKGLSKLLGQAKRLQLVVLNGCSSAGQVEKLQKEGIEAVIATSAPIDDKKALSFATEFYRAFSGSATLESAFEVGIAVLQTDAKIKDKEIVRMVGHEPVRHGRDHAPQTWILYSKTRAILGWKIREIPQLKKSDIPVKPVNEFLMTVLFDAVNEYNPFNGGKIPNPAQLRLKKKEHLVNSFPSILGGQISVLFTPDLSKKSIERVKQIQIIYFRIMVFLSSVCISHLWDKLVENPDLEISNESRYLIRSFLASGKTDRFSFLYFPLLKEVLSILEKNQLENFLEEMNQIFGKEGFSDSLQNVSSYMDGLMRLNLTSLSSEQIEISCNEGEYYLSILLKEFAFLTSYFISSNKRIHIQKIRFQKGVFKHEMRVMYGNEFAEDEEMGSRTDLLDSYSVYLVKQKEEERYFLNLTPFVVDKNSLFDIFTPDLFQYFYSDDKRFYYDHINENSLNAEFEISQIAQEKLNEEQFVPKQLMQELQKLLELFYLHIGGEK